MAFKRVITAIIGENAIKTGIGVKVSNLNMSFEIERSVTLSNNSAAFRIYNASEQTRAAILKKGYDIILKTGYEDEQNESSIFFGTIFEAKTNKEGPDIITELRCLDFGASKDGTNIIELSYSPGTTKRVVVEETALKLSLPVSGTENIKGTLNNGFTFAGKRANLLKRIQKLLRQEKLDVYFDSSEMIVYSPGKPSKFGVVNISPESGLIGVVETLEEDGRTKGKKTVQFSCLLNPKIKPNTVINISNVKNNSGAYIVDKVIFAGDNFGGDFFCEVEATE